MHANEVYPHEMHAREVQINHKRPHTRNRLPNLFQIQKGFGKPSRPPTLQTVVRWSICRDLSLQNTSFCAKLWSGPLKIRTQVENFEPVAYDMLMIAVQLLIPKPGLQCHQCRLRVSKSKGKCRQRRYGIVLFVPCMKGMQLRIICYSGRV